MLDRTQAPPFSRSLAFELLTPQEIKLPTGLSIHFISGGDQNVLKIDLILKAGRWWEDTWGAAYFVAQLFQKGTSSKTSFDIARIFDELGAHVEISAGLDTITVSLYALTKNFQQALSLLLELLTDSQFPQKELDQLKSIYLQNLKVNNEKTSFLASKAFRKNLFGDNHPYGKELDETDVQSLSRESIRQHCSTYTRDAVVIVSGNVNDNSKQQIVTLFKSLPVKRVTEKQIASTHTVTGRKLENKEGSIQSSIRMGKKIIGRKHADYPAVLFLTHVLGGYFGSRLMKNIREEKGLTYGIHASLHTLIRDNYLVIGADVNKENLDLTFQEIKKEMVRLQTEPLPADELETARNHFIGSLQSEVTTSFAHADKFRSRILFDLPSDYYQQLILKIDSLTTGELMAVAHTYFEQESFLEVAVG